MADVLIVCVREDEPQAKALADMFEAAGFSIGGAPNSDAGLRSSGAGVIVWSQASIRSRPFLDAAQRVINANKAVVASLIDPPPPSSIGDSQAFDLSRWNGDPDDPALDPLFFAVDRMVNSARAAVGAVTPEPEPPRYTPPPRRPEPAPRRAAPLLPPQPAARAEDPIESEAALWRSIRNSRDPAVFLDYLARFGPDGEFSDVAELRLKQLTAAGAPQPRNPPPPPPRMERPAVRAEPPPPRRPDPPAYRAEPPRRADPPPRAPEAAPPRRRDPPDYERRYDRADERAPKSNGGPLRALVVMVLLGGAALAGALYLGGRSDTPTQEQAQLESGPVIGQESAAGAAPLDEPSTDLSAPSVLEPQAPPAQTARREEVRREEQRREEARRQEARREEPRREQAAARAEPEPEPPTPTPVTNWSVAENSRGPVSLSPGSVSPAAPVAAPPPAPVAAAPAAVEAPRPPPGQVRWAQRPSARSVSDNYPARALQSSVGGRVVLNCTVMADLSLGCSIASETPVAMGFGRSAMSIVRGYRAQPTLSNGAPSAGAQTRVPIEFRTQ